MNTITKGIIKLKPARHTALLLTMFLPLVVSACSLINPTITKAKYDRVKSGMTLSQVQDIMGKPGENSAEFAFNIPNISVSPDTPNLPTDIKPAVYQWKNSDSSSMTAIFVNDKLVAKSQVNLK